MVISRRYDLSRGVKQDCEDVVCYGAVDIPRQLCCYEINEVLLCILAPQKSCATRSDALRHAFDAQ